MYLKQASVAKYSPLAEPFLTFRTVKLSAGTGQELVNYGSESVYWKYSNS